MKRQSLFPGSTNKKYFKMSSVNFLCSMLFLNGSSGGMRKANST